jgi:hypothetical protein
MTKPAKRRVPPTRSADFDAVRKVGLALPGAESGTAYGSPALKVNGQMFACIAVHSSAEPGSLAIRIPFESRDELLAADPSTYYLTPHYVDHPCVLVRLSRVDPEALPDLLRMAWHFVSSSAARPGGRRRRPGA